MLAFGCFYALLTVRSTYSGTKQKQRMGVQRTKWSGMLKGQAYAFCLCARETYLLKWHRWRLEPHRRLGCGNKMSINLKSTGKMVAETLSLDQSTVNKNTCLKSTPNYSRKSHSFADKCRAWWLLAVSVYGMVNVPAIHGRWANSCCLHHGNISKSKLAAWSICCESRFACRFALLKWMIKLWWYICYLENGDI